MKVEQIECSETSAYINQTPGNYPKENTLYSSFCIQVNIVVPTQPYTAGQMILLIVQTSNESICFDLCICVFDHSDIRSCTFEWWLEFWKKKVIQG